MQLNRDASGVVTPLPKPSIDTGAGLERLAAVMMNVEDPKVVSNYDTDLFRPLILQARARINEFKQFEDSPESSASLRIIADHSRATTFLIGDGVLPSNEGRGYVLRKIMRRALRHVRSLGGNLYVLSNMARNAEYIMKQAYPELSDLVPHIQRVIRAEEERFARTIDIGL